MASPTEPRKKTWLRVLIVVFVLPVAALVIFFITGTMRDPTQSLHAVIGSMVWATIGPHLVLLSFVALVLGIGGYLHWRGKLASLALSLAIVSALGSTYITARIVFSAFAAGGAVNPADALLLKPMIEVGPDESVVFKTVAGEALAAAVYRPMPSERPAPVLIYIHGGGFMAGSNTDTDADLRWFSDQGWLVFSVEYRLWTEQMPTWDKATEDVVCALVWVGANAAGFGGDAQRLALLGDSAGGNLAINVAYGAALEHQSSDCGAVPELAAVLVQYPAVDPLAIYEHGYPIPNFEPKMLVSGYIGGNPYELPDRVRAVSSYSFLSAKAPPTLILAPEKDSIVPFWSVFRFADQARLAGVDVELIPMPFTNHVYNQMASRSIGNQARLTITRRYLLELGLGPKVSQPR